MDFSGKVGRICSEKDIKGFTSKDGYAYFRRKVKIDGQLVVVFGGWNY